MSGASGCISEDHDTSNQSRLGSWRQRYERLLQAHEASVCMVDSQSLFDHWAISLCDLMKADLTGIRLLTVTGTSLVSCASGVSSDAPKASTRTILSTQTGRMPELMREKKPISIDFTKPHKEDVFFDELTEGNYLSAISIPIMHDGEILGVLDAVYRTSPWWSQSDVDYFCEIGKLIGSSIRQESSREAVIELRVLEEGRRISSEIHDNIAQVTNVVRLGAERALMSFEEDDREALEQDLRYLEATSQQAASLVRGELLALRAAVDCAAGFGDEICGILQRFEKMWSIETDLRIGCGCEELVVSDRVRLHLLRILNEALMNVSRHSCASRVVVGVECDGSFLILRVSDNGRGFDQSKVGAERLGIKIMKERADLLGGRFLIESREAEGTTLCVAAPLL